MKIRFPSRLKRAAVGYQPVGMNPSTRLAPGFETSTNATVLLSALAMRSLVPSGERPMPPGVEPGGACGKSADEIVSSTRFVFRSITYTAFVLEQATNSRPSLERARALGCSPT